MMEKLDIKKWTNLPLSDSTYWISKLALGTFKDYLYTKIGGDIVIYGSYRTGNVGDLAIGNVISKMLKKNLPFDSHMNGNITWKQNLSKYQYSILGGGQLYYSNTTNKKLKEIRNTTSLVLGVGIGYRYKKYEEELRYLEESPVVTVRDNKSAERLICVFNKCKDDVKVTACPGFLFDKIIEEKKPSKIEGSIGVSIRDVKTKNRRDVLSFLKQNFKRLSKDYDLFFIPFTLMDIVFIKKYFKKYFKKILHLQNPEDTYHTIQQMEMMIPMRFHSSIFSLLAEKPMCILHYFEKMDDISNDIGSSLHIEKIKGSEEMFFNKDKQKIRNIKEKYQKKAMINFDMINEYFKEVVLE